MPSRAFVLFAAAAFGGSLYAQQDAIDIDQISNWPAPLYWQLSAKSSNPPHRGRVQRAVAVAPAAAQPTPAVFVAMTPCRLVDTLAGNLPFGAPPFGAGETRTIPIAFTTDCTIPRNTVAYSLNIAVVPLGTTMRWLTAWDTGSLRPNTSTLNDKAGLITSNSAVVPAGDGGSNRCVRDGCDKRSH